MNRTGGQQEECGRGGKRAEVSECLVGLQPSLSAELAGGGGERLWSIAAVCHGIGNPLRKHGARHAVSHVPRRPFTHPEDCTHLAPWL